MMTYVLMHDAVCVCVPVKGVRHPPTILAQPEADDEVPRGIGWTYFDALRRNNITAYNLSVSRDVMVDSRIDDLKSLPWMHTVRFLLAYGRLVGAVSRSCLTCLPLHIAMCRTRQIATVFPDNDRAGGGTLSRRE